MRTGVFVFKFHPSMLLGEKSALVQVKAYMKTYMEYDNLYEISIVYPVIGQL